MDEISESDIGAALRPEEWPAWVRDFWPFVRVNELPRTGEVLIRCRACALALAVPEWFEPAAYPQTVMNLAVHGLRHAAAGELPWLKPHP